MALCHSEKERNEKKKEHFIFRTAQHYYLLFISQSFVRDSLPANHSEGGTPIASSTLRNRARLLQWPSFCTGVRASSSSQFLRPIVSQALVLFIMRLLVAGG
jgi:hypothetical protein